MECNAFGTCSESHMYFSLLTDKEFRINYYYYLYQRDCHLTVCLWRFYLFLFKDGRIRQVGAKWRSNQYSFPVDKYMTSSWETNEKPWHFCEYFLEGSYAVLFMWDLYWYVATQFSSVNMVKCSYWSGGFSLLYILSI